jgi:anti-sigma factor RsiW
MSDCRHQVRLNAYHDGELAPADRSAVDAHLRECPSCAAELAAIRRVSGAFAETPPREPSDERLLRLTRNVRREASDERRLLRLFRATAVAASVLLASTLAAAAHLSHRTRAAAHEAAVLDQAATRSRPVLAQWIADDLTGRPEER